MPSPAASLLEKLRFLYGQERGDACYQRLTTQLSAFAEQHPHLAQPADDTAPRLTERDVILITYGDSLQAADQPPLRALHAFLTGWLQHVVSGVHILPFFPYSSDDGFSVIDYLAVDPRLGTWDDIARIGRDFKLMVDGVINHISAQSEWFARFLAGDPAYQDFFITVDPALDLSAVVRPRTLPLLSAFETAHGTRHVWTTFSSDQIDLNFANPEVLLRIIDVLLFYVAQGARLIRLDAIAYLWKTPATSCIHLPQTHAVVQLLRAVLDAVAPAVVLITETNVPHAENIAYLGDGTNEAQLVYQFVLPPLLLHTLAVGDATALSAWAAGLHTPSRQATFFNFTASHDGIGVRPLEGILSPTEIEALVQRAHRHGGAISFKNNSDGTHSPYELNINYFDALSDPASAEPLELQARRFLVSQAIPLALIGVPGIYIHSLLGSRNWAEGVRQTGRLRSINREKLLLTSVEVALNDPASLRSQVFYPYRQLIARRIAERAFDPNGSQAILQLGPALFAVLRTAADGHDQVLALHNVTDRPAPVALRQVPLEGVRAYHDLLSDLRATPDESLTLPPYAIRWLKVQRG